MNEQVNKVHRGILNQFACIPFRCWACGELISGEKPILIGGDKHCTVCAKEYSDELYGMKFGQ